MKRLCELVEIVSNNEACVVFKPKEGTRMDLISLGCFKGNEELIRMTKGRTPEITIFYKDGKTDSYHFGEGSTTVISGSYPQQREMIRECAILDFGIVCQWSYMHDDMHWPARVQSTMGVRTVEDANRLVTLNSGGGMSCNIRVNEQTMALHVDVSDVEKWFDERGYKVDFDGVDITQGLKCGCTYGFCEPVSTLDKRLENAAERSGPSPVESGKVQEDKGF